MNIVDEHIKQCMLHYPTMAPTRAATLGFIFCVNGNGYRFKNGMLVNSSMKKERNSMDMDSHAQLSNMYNRLKDMGMDDDTMQKYSQKMKDIFDDLKNREKNIDVLCSTKVDNTSELQYFDEHFDHNWCIMRDIVWEELNVEWAHAIVEYFTVVSNCAKELTQNQARAVNEYITKANEVIANNR